MANHDYTQDDACRALSPRDLARLLIACLGSSDAPGVVLLGKKADGTYEPIKTNDAGGLQVQVNLLFHYPLWSSYSTQVQLSTVAGPKSLPSITMAQLPSGAAVALAVPMLKFRIIENTAALVNSVSGAQNIQAKKAVGGAWVTGIALGGGEFSVPVSTRESGDVIFGNQNISAQIPANGAVINFQWASALAAQDNLNFNDVQMGIRIFYTF